jgi:hypothetical protein
LLAAVGREVLAEGVELSLEARLTMATGLLVRRFEPYSAENRGLSARAVQVLGSSK